MSQVSQKGRIQIGRVAGFEGENVKVEVTKAVPGIGDLLLVEEEGRHIVLQVRKHTGGLVGVVADAMRMAKTSRLSIPMEVTVEAEPLFEVGTDAGSTYVIKPTVPPKPDSRVYLLTPGEKTSDMVMEILSREIGGYSSTSHIGWLRAGVAQRESEKDMKYFKKHPLGINLAVAVSKHILIAGQTGSGKTSGVKGIILQWGLESEDKIAWLIIDRHGEYGKEFRDLLERAMAASGKDLTVNTFRVVSRPQGGDVAIDASSLSIDDLVTVLELDDTKASMLEEVSHLILTMLRTSTPDFGWGKEYAEQVIKELTLNGGMPNGNMLALIPLLVINMFNWEGVGQPEKTGVYNVLKNAGADILSLRSLRRIILSFLGAKTRQVIVGEEGETFSGTVGAVEVFDDTDSPFKVSPILKDADCLVALMALLLKSQIVRKAGRYPWLSYFNKVIKTRDEVPRPKEKRLGVDIEVFVHPLNNGDTVILDVSTLPPRQGDTIAIAVLRRLFEERMSRGVETAQGMPVVGVVSEEAPLYLSRERVKSRYNIFARVAREGRKFGLGLLAITQLATDIDEQILANFNTMIILRTKYRRDLTYYSTVGMPPESLPKLGDREGYIYTPDFKVKEPVPIYIPAPWELKEKISEAHAEAYEESSLQGAFELAKNSKRWSPE